MRTLDRKLLRDLSRMKGQVVTIALVLASGLAALLSLVGTYRALSASRDAYYQAYAMPDAFVHLERAPEAVAARLEAIPGVASVETRLVAQVTFQIEGMLEPASGRAISLPGGGTPSLHTVALRRGRAPDPAHGDEVLLLESFADAHGLAPGDAVDVVIEGRRHRLTIAGTVLSPEWVFPVEQGVANERGFGVVWMTRPALAAATGKQGAFDDATFRLAPDASRTAVLAEIDRVLDPWGGTGAIERARQPSHYFVTGEIQQLQAIAVQVPVVFLLVAAFLLNVALGRMVHLQREQLAVLRALGYTRGAIGRHVLAFASVIVILGGALGVWLGKVFGGVFVDLYAKYFHFPTLAYRLDADLMMVGLGVCAVAAVAGGLGAVWRAVRLAPADAMRPPAPARYRRGPLSRIGLPRLTGRLGGMVVREAERRPVAMGVSIVGIAFAAALAILGRFGFDSFDYLLDVVIPSAQRDDMTVVLARPVPRATVGWFGAQPGVITAEPMRIMPVRLRAGHRHHDTMITALDGDARLRQVLDGDARPVRPPAGGVMLTDVLGAKLGVGVGDLVTVERRDGDRRAMALPVAALVDERVGMNAYMELGALARALGEQPTLNAVALDLEHGARDDLLRRFVDVPGVVMITETDEILDAMRAQARSTMGTWAMVAMLFGVVIAVGVVYNNARVALSERSRDLATLRVLGYTRPEVASVLIGQLAAQVVIAIPIGLVIGYGLAATFLAQADPEQFRFAPIVSRMTYAIAALVVIGSAIATFLVVRRKLDRIDLVGALKARD